MTLDLQTGRDVLTAPTGMRLMTGLLYTRRSTAGGMHVR